MQWSDESKEQEQKAHLERIKKQNKKYIKMACTTVIVVFYLWASGDYTNPDTIKYYGLGLLAAFGYFNSKS